MSPAAVLVAHNFYQHPGGEDQVFSAETALLAAHGHRVIRYTAHNDALKGRSSLGAVADSVWNRRVVREVRELIREHRPAVLHCHNTFPIISPAVYYAASREAVPVVQTLHNYRLICPSAILYRDGAPCEDCVGKPVAVPGVLHACYRDSRAASAVTAAVAAGHRAMRTWDRRVALYIALSEFARSRFVRGGLDPARILVKPNFVADDPGVGPGNGGHAVFVGRLSEEKGIRSLLAAWTEVGASVPLQILGDGPLRPLVEENTHSKTGIVYRGWQSMSEVRRVVGSARFLVFPSTWYETFGLVIIEAFAAGVPVIASDAGVARSLVDHGRTGLLFRAGDSRDLSDKVRWAAEHPAELAAMRIAARAEYLSRYTATANYDMLVGAYERATSIMQSSSRAHRGMHA